MPIWTVVPYKSPSGRSYGPQRDFPTRAKAVAAARALSKRDGLPAKVTRNYGEVITICERGRCRGVR